MFFKISSGVLLLTTAVFAGLYFNSADTNFTVTETNFIQTRSSHANSDKELAKRSSATKASLQSKVPTKTIYTEVSSHPDFSKEEIDDFAYLYKTMATAHKSHVKHSYPLLFDRLSLDEEGRDSLSQLLAEKSMIGRMRDRGMDDDEKLELAEKKAAMKERLNLQIEELLGAETDIFQDYEAKKQQYQQISGLKGKMEVSGDFDIAAQDNLAALMLDSRNLHKDLYKDDWGTLRESKEKADDFLLVTSERYKQMAADADFLNGDQQEVFGGFLRGVYKRYERAAEHYEKSRNKKRKKEQQ